MKKSIVTAVIAIFVPATSLADNSLFRVDDPLHHLTATTPHDAINRRAALSMGIWGAASPTPPQITSFHPGDCCYAEVAPTFFGRAPVTSQWFGFHMENDIWARVHYSTFDRAQCLVVVNGGHGEGFFRHANIPPEYAQTFTIPSVDALVRQLAAKPCDILLNSMPLHGENLFASAYTHVRDHDQIGALAVSSGSPLKYFIAPVLSSLNYVLSQRSYSKVIALGISGGGWTTTVLAALEPRITNAYAIAGSVPLAFRDTMPREGDWEQYNLPVDYLDLYAMSVAEPGRRSFLLYNGKDSCCFKEGAVSPWAKPLGEVLGNFPGAFGVYMLYAATEHAIAPAIANFILQDIDAPSN